MEIADVETIVTLLVRPLVQQLVRLLAQVILVSQSVRDTAVALLVLLTVERVVHIHVEDVADVPVAVAIALMPLVPYIALTVVVLRVAVVPVVPVVMATVLIVVLELVPIGVPDV